MNKLSALTLSVCIVVAAGHGYMDEPPNRSSLWRHPDDPAIQPYMDIVEANYNDNENFCGGFQHQVSLGYKCGVCGDAWDDPQPRDNESGGKYGKGIIVRRYETGSEITIGIQITAYHKGYFEFRICPWNDQTTPATQECLDSYLLANVDSTHQKENDVTKWYLPSSASSNEYFTIHLKLPDGLVCDQCVLQWKYHTGNSYACDDDGNCCTGCGEQEEFYSCSDVAVGIGASGTTLPPPNTGTIESTTTKAQTATTSQSSGVVTTSSSSTTQSTTTSHSTTTEATPDGCENAIPGVLYRVDGSCTSYYECTSDGRMYVTDCSPTLVFDEVNHICNYPYNVPPPCGTA